MMSKVFGENRTDFSAIAYAVIAAIIGGATVTFSKIVAVIIPTMYNWLYPPLGVKFADGNALDILTLRFAVFILLVWLFLLVVSVHSLNIGLRNAPVLVMIPIFYVLSNITSVVIGTVYFQEYETFNSTKNTVLCVFGLSMTLVGIYILSQKVAANKSEGEIPAYRVHLGSINSVYSASSRVRAISSTVV